MVFRPSPPPADEIPFAQQKISPVELDRLIGRRWAGLTRLQLAVLYVIGFHVDDDRVFRIPAHRIGILIGRGKGSDSRCAAIPLELCEFGLLHEGPRRAGGVRTWRLSRLGEAVFRELIGEKDS